MKKIYWITLLVVSLALVLTACGSPATEETTAEQSTAEEAAPAEAPAAEAAPAAQLDADTPGGIFQAAMAGVTTDVKTFLDGIPVPEDGTVSMEDNSRMDFVTSLSIEECAQFYRDTFPALGLIEIEELGKQTDFGATLIYGGYPNGKAIRVKIGRLSDISRNVQVYILEPEDL